MEKKLWSLIKKNWHKFPLTRPATFHYCDG